MHSTKLAISYENQTETLHASEASVFTLVSLMYVKIGTTCYSMEDQRNRDKLGVATYFFNRPAADTSFEQ